MEVTAPFTLAVVSHSNVYIPALNEMRARQLEFLVISTDSFEIRAEQ